MLVQGSLHRHRAKYAGVLFTFDYPESEVARSRVLCLKGIKYTVGRELVYSLNDGHKQNVKKL